MLPRESLFMRSALVLLLDVGCARFMPGSFLQITLCQPSMKRGLEMAVLRLQCGGCSHVV